MNKHYIWGKFVARSANAFMPSLLVLSLSSCVMDSALLAEKKIETTEAAPALRTAALNQKNLMTPYIQEALEDLDAGRLSKAQANINKALKFDPGNAQLHFLNGLIYHLRAENGDSSQRPLAAIGYQLALKHDPSNYWAAFQLGHIHYKEQRFRAAEEAFAYAMLLAPDDIDIAKALIAAAYYAHDLSTANQVIRKVSDKLGKDPKFLLTAAMVNAASGNFKDAQSDLWQYRKESGFDRVSERIVQRMSDWQKFYEQTPISVIEVADATMSDSGDIFSSQNSALGVGPSKKSGKDGGDSDASSKDDDADGDKKKKKTESSKSESKLMAMVDVIIIRSEERLASRKGVNLLNGLSATLGGTSFTFNSTRTVNGPSTGSNTMVNTFTYAPTLSLAATYSLNVFNDYMDHNEVIARPSLLALDGKKSEFFTGSSFLVELNGSSGSEGTVTQIPVGIQLDVTPSFNADGTVQLNVAAARAFVETKSSLVGFSNFGQVSKTTVTANVRMNFDETVIISGLSEKEAENLHDGVPFLQDVPGLQYLFSREDALTTNKSVVILLTPRQASFVGQIPDDNKVSSSSGNGQGKNKAIAQPHVDELNKLLSGLKPESNLGIIFKNIERSSVYRQFRTGDVQIENWDLKPGLDKRIHHALNFLYY